VTRLIVDAGPLVALVSRTDAQHQWTRRAVQPVSGPLFTTDPVISEALFLLRRSGSTGNGLLDLLDRSAVEVVRFDPHATVGLSQLCRKYADVPMSWADASLVHLSELLPQAKLLTFDSDFAVYRRFGAERIPLIKAR
jgi:predicted nucleic acid-binding protein